MTRSAVAPAAVSPSELPLAKRVRGRKRIVWPQIRILDERRLRVERGLDRQDGRELLDINANELRRAARRILRFCDDGRHRLARKFRFPDSEHRPVGEDRPVPWNRLRQVVRREDAAHSRNAKGLAFVNGDDPRMRAAH